MPSPNDPSGTPGRRLPWRGIVVLVVVVLVGLLPLARAVDPGGNDREVPLDQGGPDREPRVRNTVRFDFLGRRDALAVSLVGGGLENAGAYKPDGVSPLLIGAGLVLVLLGAGGAVLLVARAPEDDEPVVGRRTTVAGGTPPARGPGPDGGAAPVAGSHERTERGGW